MAGRKKRLSPYIIYGVIINAVNSLGIFVAKAIDERGWHKSKIVYCIFHKKAVKQVYQRKERQHCHV